MILSQTSEYAIRATSTIAIQEHNGPVTAIDLSEQISIPSTYLSKILRKLVNAKILKATRGHNGGFILAKDPSKIKLIHVLQAVDSIADSRHCIFGWRMCNSEKPCLLHHSWTKVKESFYSWIENTTLEEIKHNATQLNWLTSETEKVTKKLSSKTKKNSSNQCNQNIEKGKTKKLKVLS